MGGIKSFLCLLGLLTSFSSFADTLPVISPEQLQIGNFWVWTYYTEGDFSRPYSAERYEVIGQRGTQILFEIRSRYDDHSDFKAHTRFRVDLAKCLRAFKNPEIKTNFMIDLYPQTDGQWAKIPIQTPSIAFEEKFNCNPIFHTQRGSLYETRFESAQSSQGAERLFQQWPKSSRSQLRAFYFLNHPELKAIAYRKDFNPGTPHFYEMRLTASGKKN
jgi:hypothetical protein